MSVVAALAAAFAMLVHVAGGYQLVGNFNYWSQMMPPQRGLQQRSSPTCWSSGLPTTSMCASGAAQVALTREAGKNDKLAELLRKDGISSVEIPCIAHEDGPDLPLLPTALQDTPGLAYVVVTSPEAAKVFISGWKAAGSPVAISVACVGAATGETLEKGGVTPVFTPSKATGETLTAELPFPEGSSPPHVVLYPASAQASNQLEDGLKARGFHVRRLDTYDTVPARWDADFETAAQRVSVAAFGSPSAVKIWAARVGVFRANHGIRDGERERGAIAACIGNTSATACREAGWPEEAIFYPESPGIEAWAKAVRDALAAVETLCMAKPAAK